MSRWSGGSRGFSPETHHSTATSDSMFRPVESVVGREGQEAVAVTILYFIAVAKQRRPSFRVYLLLKHLLSVRAVLFRTRHRFPSTASLTASLRTKSTSHLYKAKSTTQEYQRRQQHLAEQRLIRKAQIASSEKHKFNPDTHTQSTMSTTD